MINITLPDGSVKQFDHAVTALEVCQSISRDLHATQYAPKLTVRKWT